MDFTKKIYIEVMLCCTTYNMSFLDNTLHIDDVTNGQKSEIKLQARERVRKKRRERRKKRSSGVMWVDIFICKYLTLNE